MKRFLTIIALFAVCVAVMAQTPRVKGDVNGDGSVTSVDVTVLYNFLLNGDVSGLANGDVDGDGYITSGDVTFVYNILLGIEPAEEEHEYVDLGLPSGTLWATTNVGAENPEDYGDYFAWGETTPKENYSWSNYQWCNGTYNTLTKYCTKSNYGYNGFVDNKTELDSEDDAATANWGPEWCMPSYAQIQELLDNCTTQLTTRNGVNGYLVTSNLNGASFFVPAAGKWLSGGLDVAGSYGYFWSRTLYTDYPYGAYNMGFQASYVTWFNGDRYNGRSVRAVRVQEKEHEYVDMGLPSGTLWATTNVGADKPEDYGDYFAWGETAPKDVYDWTTYQWCNGSENLLTKYCSESSFGNDGFTDNLTELDPEDDAATANWGEEWCMPSKDQIQELKDNCTTEWTTRNGVYGRLFTSSINGATLFLPAAGLRWNGLLYDVGSFGHFWSRTLYSSSPCYAYIMGSDLSLVYWTCIERNYGLTVRPVRVQEKEHEYVDMGLPSGTLWATTNVGADNPEDYGDYFAWGETTPKDVYDWSTYQWCEGSRETLTKYCTRSVFGNDGFTDGKTELDPEDDAAIANWGPKWCMPTETQLNELYHGCTWHWTTSNGVNGFLVTSNYNGASLFFPATDDSFTGCIWSRSLYGPMPYCAYFLYFDYDEPDEFNETGEYVSISYVSRDSGLTIRAVRVPQQ